MFKSYKKVIAFVLLFTMIICRSIYASNTKDVIDTKEQSVYNINVGFYKDTQNSKVITWQTDNYSKPKLFFKTKNGKVNSIDPIGVKNKDFEANKNYYTYTAYLENLEPNTTYYYNIGNDDSFPYVFKTASGNDEPFTFLTFSDTQALNKDYKKYIGYSFSNSLTGFSDIAFVSFTGDMVDVANRQQWRYFFDAIKGKIENYTFVPVVGNHDYARKGRYYYKGNFTNPYNTGKNTGYNAYSSFVYQNALFFVLNSEENIDDQIEFMNETIKNSDAKWRIVLMHKSLYGGMHSNDSDVLELKEKLAPVFLKNDIDIVISGHDHIYQRSYFMKNDKNLYLKNQNEVYEKPEGVLYITSGAAGPKTYKYNKNEWVYKYWLPNSSDSNKPSKKVFNQVTIDNEKLILNVYTSDFEKVDSVTIVK